MSDKYVIYCDESDRKSKKYCYFFGALILKNDDILEVSNYLQNAISNYNSELKWSKISNSYIDNSLYKNFIKAIFELIESERIKIRIFFMPNIFLESHSNQSDEISFFKLYHTFLTHTFKGFKIESVMLDRLPIQTKTEVYKFKTYLSKKLNLNSSQISDIDSSKHIIIQAIDILTGAISFKLNKKDLERNCDGKIGKKTKSKLNIYKYINARIRSLSPQNYYKYFNIGVSTGTLNCEGFNRKLFDKYRHWCYFKFNE